MYHPNYLRFAPPPPPPRPISQYFAHASYYNSIEMNSSISGINSRRQPPARMHAPYSFGTMPMQPSPLHTDSPISFRTASRPTIVPRLIPPYTSGTGNHSHHSPGTIVPFTGITTNPAPLPPTSYSQFNFGTAPYQPRPPRMNSAHIFRTDSLPIIGDSPSSILSQMQLISPPFTRENETRCQRKQRSKVRKKFRYQQHYANVILPSNPILPGPSVSKTRPKLSTIPSIQIQLQLENEGLKKVIAHLENKVEDRDTLIRTLQSPHQNGISRQKNYTKQSLPATAACSIEEKPTTSSSSTSSPQIDYSQDKNTAEKAKTRSYIFQQLEPEMKKRKTLWHVSVLWQRPLLVADQDVLNSIQPQQWLTTSAILTAIWMLIRRYALTDAVFLCPPEMIQHFQHRHYDMMVTLCFKYSMQTFAHIIVPMNLESIGSGTHWILGIISFPDETVIIADSLSSSPNRYSTKIIQCFHQLLVIVGAVKCCLGLPASVDGWTITLCDDCAKQTNSYDCGLHVCINVDTFLRSRRMSGPCETPRDRLWLRHMINSFDEDARSDYVGLLDRDISLPDNDVIDHAESLLFLDSSCKRIKYP